MFYILSCCYTKCLKSGVHFIPKAHLNLVSNLGEILDLYLDFTKLSQSRFYVARLFHTYSEFCQ